MPPQERGIPPVEERRRGRAADQDDHDHGVAQDRMFRAAGPFFLLGLVIIAGGAILVALLMWPLEPVMAVFLVIVFVLAIAVMLVARSQRRRPAS